MADRDAPTIATPIRDEGERRRLTVVRCDLVDSTRVQEAIGDELYRDLQRQFGEHCRASAIAAGADIIRFVGDGFVFAFGRQSADEHDPQRAIRFGLALSLSVEALRDVPARLRIRTAVATGSAIVDDRDAASDDHGVTGRVLNLSARLLARANPSEVVVADQTHALVRGQFEFRDLGTTTVKGFSDPVGAWVALRESTETNRFDAQHEFALRPIVGREVAQAHLRTRWERIDETGSVAFLRGDAGIGKSRLTRWFLDELIHPYTQRVRVDCVPHEGNALEPLRRYFIGAASLTSDGRTDANTARLQGLLTRTVDDLVDATDLIGSLVFGREARSETGSAPDAMRTRRYDVIVEHFLGLASFGPLTVVIEDLHWADEGTLDVLERLIEALPQSRLIVVATLRAHESSERLDQLFMDVEGFDLQPLSTEDVIELAHQVAPDLVESARETVIDRADGVPLFVENLCLEARESVAGEVETTRARPVTSEVPEVLWHCLMARLDRLGAEARQAAQIASILGRSFAVDTLCGMHSQLDEASLSSLIPDIVLPMGDGVYQFRHALVREVAYGSLLNARLGELHQLAAAALERDPSTPAAVVARHLELTAGFLIDRGKRNQALIDAADRWSRAARSSVDRSEIEEGVDCLDHALSLVSGRDFEADDAERALRLELEVWTERAYVESIYRGWSADEVRDALASGFDVAAQLGNPAGVFEVYSIAGGYHLTRGAVDYAGELGNECRAMIDQSHPLAPRHRVIAAKNLVGHRFLTGRHEECVTIADEALALYDDFEDVIRSPDRRLVSDDRVSILVYRQMSLLSLGRVDEAVESALAAVHQGEALGHGNSVAFAKTFWAATRYHRRDSEAIDVARDSFEFASRNQYATFIGGSQMMIGAALIERGELAPGLAEVAQGASGHVNISAESYQPFVLALFASARLAQGQPPDALGLTDRAMESMERNGDRWYQPEILRIRGLALAAQEPTQELVENANAAFRSSLEIARTQAARFWELRTAVSWADSAAGKQLGSEPIEALERALDGFDQGADLKDVVRAREILSAAG